MHSGPAADAAAPPQPETVQNSEDADTPHAVLRDLPDPMWPGLLDALRRTFDDTETELIPRRLRPFLGWHPERLDRRVVRDAVIAALPADARFRQALLDQLTAADRELTDAVGTEDVAWLRTRFEVGAVAAALIGADRWDALVVLSAMESERVHGDQAGETSEAATEDAASDEIAEARRRRVERDRIRDLQGRLRRAEQHAERLSRELAKAKDRIGAAERERGELARELTEVQSRHRSRLARLKRQTRQAQDDALEREERVQALADELRRLLAGLVGETDATVPDTAQPSETPESLDPSEQGDTAAGAVGDVPRGIHPATPGRPCRLPPGVTPETTTAVEALLQVDQLELILDGYNLTKDVRGCPNAPLAEQRLWLLRAVAGVAATRRVRPTIVFDGQIGSAAGAPSARGVITVFTEPDELADDRIKEYVRAMREDTPVLVVTSDREVRDAVEEYGASVVSSGIFLKAIRASS